MLFFFTLNQPSCKKYVIFSYVLSTNCHDVCQKCPVKQLQTFNPDIFKTISFFLDKVVR